MEKEIVKQFLNEPIKLVQKDNFILYGKITYINDDSLIFETDQKKSIILLENIKEVVGEL